MSFTEELDGWKVVQLRERDGKIEYWSASAVVDDQNNDAVQYLPNKPVRPKPELGGALAVFKVRASAKHFAANVPMLRVFPCKYTRSEERCLWFYDEDDLITTPANELPRGTDFADSVTIIV
jgi:hypothetical protein